MIPQRHSELVQILKNHFDEEELRGLCFELGEDYDDLSSRGRANKARELVRYLGRRGRVPELIEIGKQLRPHAPWPELPQPKEPEPTPFIPFANRQTEWEKVVLYPEGQYYLFEGPAGYGKTSLLNKLEEEFKERNWLCAYVSLQEHNTVPQIANCVAQKLQVDANVLLDNPSRIGMSLGKAVAEQRESTEAKGLALLLDVDHEPWESLIPTLQKVVEGFIPGTYDGLIKSKFDYFKSTPKGFRVVLAGRYLASRIEKFKQTYKFDVIQLRPLDYEVVQSICEPYIRDRQGVDSKEAKEFAANVLFYSGGHPRCIVRTLQKFEEASDTPSDFFRAHRDDIEEIAYQEANWVYASIMRDWRRAFGTLCVYRRLDHFLLRQLLDERLVWHGMVDDEYDLADKLKLSYLMDWEDKLQRHLSDGITRRLLNIRLRLDTHPDEFQNICRQAEGFCLECLDRSGAFSSYWAVEVLFEYLQGNVARINDEAKRQDLRQRFFEMKLPQVLKRLASVQGQAPRLQKQSLLGILESDWEFQFTLNYYLRDGRYDESPYQKMRERIEQFFASNGTQKQKSTK